MPTRRRSRMLTARTPKIIVFLALLMCPLAAPAALAGAAPDSDELLAAGRHALETRCARCHAIGLAGESKHPEAPPFRDVMKRYPAENLEEALAEGISSGHPDMPEYVLSPDEIAAVVRYLNSLEQP